MDIAVKSSMAVGNRTMTPISTAGKMANQRPIEVSMSKSHPRPLLPRADMNASTANG